MVPSYHLANVLCQVYIRAVKNIRNDSQEELCNVCAELQNGANKRPHLVRLDCPVAVLCSVGIWSVAIARASHNLITTVQMANHAHVTTHHQAA